MDRSIPLSRSDFTERGSRVKPLRFAPTANVAR